MLLPPSVGYIQTAASFNHPDGWSRGDFALTVDDPPICTVGFMPQNQWRSPSDTSDVDTPDGLYCKLPQDSPLSVRGARNYPCMGHPGKRAPTVEICNSDKPFMPLAMRQHVLGPSPLDPNLLVPGHTTRRPGHRGPKNLRPGRGNTAATRGGPAGNTPRAAGSKSTTGHAGRSRATGAVVGQHVDAGSGLSAHSATRRPRAGRASPTAARRALTAGGSATTRHGQWCTAAGASKLVRGQGISTCAVGRGCPVRSAYRSLCRSGREVVPAVGSGNLDRAQEVAGLISDLKVLVASQPILSSRSGSSIPSHWFCPQAPLGPIVLSFPASTGDPIWNSPLPAGSTG